MNREDMPASQPRSFFDGLSRAIRAFGSLAALIAFALLGVASASCSASPIEADASDPPICVSQEPLAMGPCDPAYFHYVDPICGGGCGEAGDGRCHQLCEEDADCTDPCRPKCRELGLYDGGDGGCNRVIQICDTADSEDCPCCRGE